MAGLRVRLRVPELRGPDRTPRVLLFLHGCGGSAEEMVRVARLDAAAGAAGMVVACPQQDHRRHRDGCWRWTGGRDQGGPAEEVERILEVAGRVARQEAAPVFLAGFGAGGALAVRVVSTAPARFAGLAVHSGVPASLSSPDPGRFPPPPAGEEAPAEEARTLERRMGRDARPVPLFVLHGSADERVHPALGTLLARGWMTLHGRLGIELRAPEVSSGRASRGGLQYRRTIWRDRAGGLRGEAWRVEGLGHEWSGGRPLRAGVPGRGPDATREILRFFDRAT